MGLQASPEPSVSRSASLGSLKAFRVVRLRSGSSPSPPSTACLSKCPFSTSASTSCTSLSCPCPWSISGSAGLGLFPFNADGDTINLHALSLDRLDGLVSGFLALKINEPVFQPNVNLFQLAPMGKALVDMLLVDTQFLKRFIFRVGLGLEEDCWCFDPVSVAAKYLSLFRVALGGSAVARGWPVATPAPARPRPIFAVHSFSSSFVHVWSVWHSLRLVLVRGGAALFQGLGSRTSTRGHLLRRRVLAGAEDVGPRAGALLKYFFLCDGGFFGVLLVVWRGLPSGIHLRTTGSLHGLGGFLRRGLMFLWC